MNKDRRNEIARIKAEVEALVSKAEDLINDIESVRDEEQEYFDNMPESFQQGEKGEVAEAAVASLDQAMEALQEMVDADAAGALEEASA